MKTFFRTLFFSIILGAFIGVPASYFFIKDFVQPRVQETISRVDALNTNLQNQNQTLEQILAILNRNSN